MLTGLLQSVCGFPQTKSDLSEEGTETSEGTKASEHIETLRDGDSQLICNWYYIFTGKWQVLLFSYHNANRRNQCNCFSIDI